MFECELALEFGMTLGELRQRMSAHELTVVWPLYFASRNKEQERLANARSGPR